MKIKLLSISILSVFLIVTSCSKAESDNGSQNTKHFLTAKINGVAISVDLPLVYPIDKDADGYLISASAETFGIGIGLNQPVALGTFAIKAGELVPQLRYTETSATSAKVWEAYDKFGSGTITITAINEKSIEGTFSFTGINRKDDTTKEITDGKFKAKKM